MCNDLISFTDEKEYTILINNDIMLSFKSHELRKCLHLYYSNGFIYCYKLGDYTPRAILEIKGIRCNKFIFRRLNDDTFFASNVALNSEKIELVFKTCTQQTIIIEGCEYIFSSELMSQRYISLNASKTIYLNGVIAIGTYKGKNPIYNRIVCSYNDTFDFDKDIFKNVYEYDIRLLGTSWL